MANRALFQSSRGPLPRETDVRNAEGAGAYAFGPRHALAQYAATGTSGFKPRPAREGREVPAPLVGLLDHDMGGPECGRDYIRTLGFRVRLPAASARAP